MYKNKKVMVLGLARSGIAAARLLLLDGAKLILCDSKDTKAIRDTLNSLDLKDSIICMGQDFSKYIDEIDTLVISPGVPIDSEIVLTARQKGKEVIGELELASRYNKCPLLAVTGTNGKTTSVTLLGSMMENHGYIAHVAGNIGYPLSDAVINSKQSNYLIAEVSSFQLESIQNFKPKVAAILNITEDHLNRHKTMKEYIKLKFRIFENQDENDFAILNYDDQIIRDNIPNIKSKVYFFSRKKRLEEGAYIKGDGLYISIEGVETYICNINKIKIPGPHNLENAMAMALAARLVGLKPQVIGHTLHSFAGVEHRIEAFATINDIVFINDSKGTNTDSTSKAINSMYRPTTLIMGGYDKKSDFTNLCKEILESKYIKNLVLIGQTSKIINDTFVNLGYNKSIKAIDMQDAVNKAISVSSPGYNILLSPACASFDMYNDYEERGRDFKNIVNGLSK